MATGSYALILEIHDDDFDPANPQDSPDKRNPIVVYVVI